MLIKAFRRQYEIPTRLLFFILGVILLVVATVWFVQSCDSRRNKGAQSRVDTSQQGAATNSAADAINTVTGVGSNQAASEELGRDNERDIRAAEGANSKIGAGVSAAGIRALCKRKAYADDPKCKEMRP